MNQDFLRKVIREEISRQSESGKNHLQESYIWYDPGEFYDAFIGPWVNLGKVIMLGSQKTLANVKTSLQLFFTFNDKKAKLIYAKNKDRVKAIDGKVDGILQSMEVSKDMAAAAFIMNPAAYLIFAHGEDVFDGTVDYLKGAGFGDFLPGESSTDQHGRSADEKGPLAKVLSGLEQIFLIAHADNPGQMLAEAEDEEEENEAPAPGIEPEIEPDLIIRALEETGDLAKLEKLKEEALKSFFEGPEGLNALAELGAQQIAFMKKLGEATNLEQLQKSLNDFKTAMPDAEMGGVEKLPSELEKDYQTLKGNEEVLEKVVKEILTKDGNSDPGEEEMKAVPENKIDEELKNIAFGNVMGSLQSGLKEMAGKIVAGTEKMIDDGVTGPDGMLKAMGVPSEMEEEVLKDPVLKTLIKNAKSKVQSS